MLALLGPLPERASVLDLCCGVGRHSIELARRGFRVTGVDRFEPFLERARSAEKAGGPESAPPVEWIHDDMRRFRRPGAFDAAISLFTSFGYFHDDEEEGAVLRNLCDSLKPGGRLLIDVMGKEIVARGFKQSMVQRRMLPEGEAMLIDEPRVGDDWHHIASTWTFLWPNGSRQEFELKCRVYSAVELKRLLAEAAFAEVRVFGGLDGSIYDQNARRLVAVADAEASVRAARELLLGAVTSMWETVAGGHDATIEQRIGLRLACWHAARSSVHATDLMFEAAGSTAAYRNRRMQRIFRDVHVAASHVTVGPVAHEAAGRAMLGIEINAPLI